MSDSKPDEPEWQYLQVPELPELALDLVPLTYEEARCLTFMREDGSFQPNREDSKILSDLDCNNLIKVGGRRSHIYNAPDFICRNKQCQWNNERSIFRFVAMLPPISVNGKDDFWHEFQGGHVDFCFGLCYYCGTIVGFNVAG